MNRTLASAVLRPLLVLLFVAAPAHAAPPDERDVPEALRPWIPWVLATHPDARCPRLGATEERACTWASRVALELTARGGSFDVAWQVFGRGFVTLPGGAGAWPQDVQVDGRPAAVVERGGAPAVWLEPGVRRASGRIAWNALPPLLPVPAEMGLVTLSLDGSRVTGERREPDGRLWLGARGEGPSSPGEPARADLDVRRLVRDEIPLALETRLDLDVAGPSRELRIAGAVLPGFVPTVLETVLPARVEPGGDLVLQVRPGRYTVTLGARHDGPVSALTLPEPLAGAASAEPAAATPLRDDEEIWAFEAEPALRVVELAGAPAVDPQQTTLPAEWRGYPAFLMKPGTTLRLEERRRGDADPAPDALRLRRLLWLDFDGSGYTVSDRVTGALHRTWRLEASPALALGRVSVGGVDQPVTTLPGSDDRGVELRESALDVSADARIEGRHGRIPAVGYRHDFQDVAETLQLPPGWRLLHASGVDAAEPTWIGSWSLLDLFFVLVIALATGRLLGRTSGVLALAALGLSWLEPDAPQWPWAAVVVAEALVRMLPEGAIRRGMRFARLGLLVVLAIAVVSFAVQHLRTALYPTLERPFLTIGQDGGAAEAFAMRADAISEPAGAPAETRTRRHLLTTNADVAEQLEEAPSSFPAALPAPAPASGAAKQAARKRYAPDPTLPVTTGPGLPEWAWSEVSLTWRGPVRADQELSLVLLSPGAGLLLAWLRVALVAGLTLALLRAAFDHRHGSVTPGKGGPDGAAPPAAGIALLVVLAATWVALAAARADLPGPELLGTLESRLLEPPACARQCATLGRLRVEATPEVLRLRLEASAAAPVGVPLPGGAGHWLPEDVLLDGQPASALRRDGDGTLWIALPEGAHQVVLQGRTGSAATIDLPLPFPPQRVESELTGFVLEGVRADGVPAGALRLVREDAAPGAATAPAPRAGAAGASASELPALPPFFRVERRLSIGVEFEVVTEIVRTTPPGVAASLAVPLLPGESVTSEVGRVEGGRLLVNLAPGDLATSWRSVLTSAPSLTLEAAVGVPWVESWVVDASPLWHVEATGLVPIVPGDAPLRVRTFRPWPGERVTLAFTRPAGIPGATLTIDRSQLTVSPGQRATDVSLDLTLRSSRGGQHAITLPDGSELLDVAIDGRTQPLRLDGARLVLPIEPRTQSVSLRWRESHGVRARLRTPDVDLGAPSVNAHLTVAMPADRWTLFLSGPPVGPAILFWSALAVLVPVAYGLARTRLTPLGVVSWFALGLGLTQVPVAASAIVAGWLLALGWRGRAGARLGDGAFRALQVALVAGTLVALGVLFFAIQQGLLGLPEMQIAGNGSRFDALQWYQDRAGTALPHAGVYSLPLWAYRVAMLAWALWLAAALVGWLRWGWEQLGSGGFWRPFAWRRRKAGRRYPR